MNTYYRQLPRQSSRPFLASGFAIFVIVLLAAFVVFSTDKNTAPQSSNNLSFSDITIKSLPTPGPRVWVISGKVSNNSGNQLQIPSISMRAGEKGSSGYFNWIYHPALQTLAPGASFRFRTAVQKPVGSTDPVKLEFIGAQRNQG